MRAELTLLALVAALVGCAGPRPMTPPDSQVPPLAAWRTTAGQSDTPLSATWWEQFGDPGLTRTVAEAIAQNDDIRIAAARVEQVAAQTDLAQARRGPQLNAGLGVERDRSINPANGRPEVQTAYEPTLMFSFDADLFGRLRSASAAAQAELLAGRAAQADVRLLVAATAARQWFTLRSLDAQLVTLQETLKARGETLALIQRRVRVGYASQLDLAQAESAYKGTEEQIPPIQLAIHRAEDNLCVLLGRPPGDIARDALEVEPVLPAIPGSLPSSLLRRRPDIVAAEERLVAADHTLDSARAAFMPDLVISGNLGSITSTLLHNQPVDVFSLGANMLMPIFDAGRLQAQQDATAAARDEAAFGYRKAAIAAFAQVEDALASTQRLHEQLATLQAQRVAQEKTLRIATERYRAGYTPFLDQLDAQRELLAVDLALWRTRSSELNAYVTLFQALGGGWDRAEIEARASTPEHGP